MTLSSKRKCLIIVVKDGAIQELPFVDQESPLDPLVMLYGQLCGDAIYIEPRQQPDGSFLYDYQDVGAQMQGQIGFNKTGLSRDEAIRWGQHCVAMIQAGQTGDEYNGETKDGQGGQYPWHGVGNTQYVNNQRPDQNPSQ